MPTLERFRAAVGDMIKKHDRHVGRARVTLQSLVYEMHGRDEYARDDSFPWNGPGSWHEAHDIVKAMFVGLPDEAQADPLAVAVRDWIEDWKKPIFGWREGNVEEKARADARMASYQAVWDRVVAAYEASR